MVQLTEAVKNIEIGSTVSGETALSKIDNDEKLGDSKKMEPQRLSRVEAEVSGIKDELKVIDIRLAKHGQEIDQLSLDLQKTVTDFLVIRKDVESIDCGVRRVEETVNKSLDKIDKLQEQRITDHYEGPLNTYKRTIWLAVGVAVGLITTFVLTALFPMLK